MTTARWQHRPEGSNWGEFGPDDQLGRLNLITSQKLRQAIAEVRSGVTFSLSLPLDYPGGTALNPRRRPPILRPTLRDGQPNFACTLADPDCTDVFNDDLAIIHLQYSTQWDSLAHVGGLFDVDGDGKDEKVFYNGFTEADLMVPEHAGDAGISGALGDKSTSTAHKLGIEHMAAHGVQGRAVMVDLAAHFGLDQRRVGYDDLVNVLEADGIEVETGDVLCLHTGFAQMVMEMAGQPDPHILHNACCALDGRDQRLLDWITASGVAAIAADNYAVESFPAGPSDTVCCSSLPLHEHCLFKNGIHLGELWHLSPLAAWLRERGRHHFLLTAPPLRLPGAVGSPVTPVATV